MKPPTHVHDIYTHTHSVGCHAIIASIWDHVTHQYHMYVRTDSLIGQLDTHLFLSVCVILCIARLHLPGCDQ